MKSSEYWKLRFEQLEQAQNQLEEKILVWYQRIVKNNGVTMAEAHKLLTSAELEGFK